MLTHLHTFIKEAIVFLFILYYSPHTTIYYEYLKLGEKKLVLNIFPPQLHN